MKRFMSSLGPRMVAFLELKRAMGRSYENVESEIRRFDRYVAETHEPVELVTRELVQQWLAAKPHLRASTQRSRAGTLRQFCLYLARVEPRTYVPDRAIFPVRGPVFKAHIYSDTELRALVTTALTTVISARFSLLRKTIDAMVLTLYATGLRVGEVCRLRVSDVDLEAGTLFVSKTKFFKSRLVPISPSLADHLRSTRDVRTAKTPMNTHAPFFVNRCSKAFTPQGFSAIFRKLVAAAGIPRRAGVRGPCAHDVRHTFATNRVLRWYREGADVQAKLPLLATYMGHGSVLSTHVYLTATAELLQEASRRFEHAHDSLFAGDQGVHS
jgi:integrase